VAVVERTDAMRRPGARLYERTLHLSLPPALGISADIGLALSLVLVLVGWGPVGMIAGIALGVASIAGVVTAAVLHLAGSERRVIEQEVRPAYAFATEQRWEQDSQRAA
jgi:hypothetical protein